MKYIVLIIMTISKFSLFAQNTTFEQAALNYYTEVIHPVEYITKEKYVLDDSVSLRKSNFLYGVCFENYLKVQKPEMLILDSENIKKVVASSFFLPLRRKKLRKRTIIYVNQANVSPQKTVFVEVVLRNQRIGKHYYIELTLQKEPIRWCKKEVVF